MLPDKVTKLQDEVEWFPDIESWRNKLQDKMIKLPDKVSCPTWSMSSQVGSVNCILVMVNSRLQCVRLLKTDRVYSHTESRCSPLVGLCSCTRLFFWSPSLPCPSHPSPHSILQTLAWTITWMRYKMKQESNIYSSEAASSYDMMLNKGLSLLGSYGVKCWLCCLLW